MASHYLAASSFTRQSLVEHGVAAASIAVVPYGVDLEHYRPSERSSRRTDAAPLELLFVGRINQRKGLTYLLDALRLLNTAQLRLTICGRVVDDLSLFKPFEAQVQIRPSVSAEELVRAYQSADLFVFPSVAEGFGQVLLESLASGLPILSTTHTAAPDLIDEECSGLCCRTPPGGSAGGAPRMGLDSPQGSGRHGGGGTAACPTVYLAAFSLPRRRCCQGLPCRQSLARARDLARQRPLACPPRTLLQ